MSRPGTGSAATKRRLGWPSSEENASQEAASSASSSARSGLPSVTSPPACGATRVLDVSSMRSTARSLRSQQTAGLIGAREGPSAGCHVAATVSPTAIRPDCDDARVDAEERAVVRRRGGAAAPATSPACPGRASGSRSARTGAGAAARRRPRTAASRPPSRARPTAARVELEVEVGAEAAQVERACPAPPRAPRASPRVVTSTLRSRSWMPATSRRSRTVAAEVVAPARCAAADRPTRPACAPPGAVTARTAGRSGSQPGVGRERVAPRARRAAAAPRAR